jgi:hypothetical protein
MQHNSDDDWEELGDGKILNDGIIDSEGIFVENMDLSIRGQVLNMEKNIISNYIEHLQSENIHNTNLQKTDLQRKEPERVESRNSDLSTYLSDESLPDLEDTNDPIKNSVGADDFEHNKTEVKEWIIQNDENTEKANNTLISVDVPENPYYEINNQNTLISASMSSTRSTSMPPIILSSTSTTLALAPSTVISQYLTVIPPPLILPPPAILPSLSDMVDVSESRVDENQLSPQNEQKEIQKILSQMPTKIHVISDIHVGNDNIYKHKKKLIDKVMNEIAVKDNFTNVVIIAGDLTDHGFGKAQCACFWCCLCMNSCFSTCSCDAIDETKKFEDEILKPLQKVCPNVLITHGNHDESSDNMSYPVLDLIKRTYVNTTQQGYYNHIINDIMYIVLGKYPNKDAIKYFNYIHSLFGGKYPYVVIFHYQLSKSYNHDFWSEEEKETFGRCVDDSTKNVIAIVVGHIHVTMTEYFYTASKKIPVILGAGMDSYSLLTVRNYSIESYMAV